MVGNVWIKSVDEGRVCVMMMGVGYDWGVVV